MRSAARLLAIRSGVMPGRASLRIVLVTALIVLQSVEVGGDPTLSGTPGLWILPTLVVGALAASVGFDVAQRRSASRWRDFLGDQLRTALPAYIVAIVAAAFVLGPLVTSEPRAEFLRDPYAYSYLLNLVAFPVYTLPGVFEFNNLSDVVNQNVWIAPVVLLLGIVAVFEGRRPVVRLAPLGLAILVALAALLRSRLGTGLPDAQTLAGLFSQGLGLTAILGGLLGIAASRFGNMLPINLRYAFGAAAFLLALLLVGRAAWGAAVWLPVICAVPSAYLALYVSIRGVGGRLVRLSEPYLLGAFLFSFPLQQLATVLLPGTRNDILLNVLAGGGVAIGIAILLQEGLGRRLRSGRQRAWAETEAGIYASTIAAVRPRRPKSRTILTYAIGGAILVLVIVGAMAMTYFAMLPESSGM